LACVLVGLLAGALSALLTLSVYAAEDCFQRIPIHWMWWPSIGGLAIGLGGLIFRKHSALVTTASGICCKAASRQKSFSVYCWSNGSFGQSRSVRALPAACSLHC